MNTLNTYRTGADEGGHFGIYGGRYVAETLMPLIKDVENFHLNCKYFPVIKLSDPIARYYGAKTDDIFKIERFSPCSGKYISYRIVQ